MTLQQYDMVVIGGGNAGLSAAYRVARAGRRVALVDKGPVGGPIARARVISEGKSGKILGAQLFGSGASENIHFFALAIQCGVTSEHLKEMVYAYPHLRQHDSVALCVTVTQSNFALVRGYR
jgi:pyruvate/2-oxoglutarate dehydrogenase complex dihydrolipoamide dehydrogenase (E3) component